MVHEQETECKGNQNGQLFVQRHLKAIYDKYRSRRKQCLGEDVKSGDRFPLSQLTGAMVVDEIPGPGESAAQGHNENRRDS